MFKTLAGSSEAFGRAALASLFVLGGVNKILNYEATGLRMAEVGLEPAALMLPATIALELGGGLIVAFGRHFAWAAAAALAVFTLATNFFFHRFWEMTGVQAEAELSLFFKNVSVFGGLVYVCVVSFGRAYGQKP
jgi:putative oxidoreductase